MRISKRQLRRLIRESLLLEKGEAYASDIAKLKPEIRDWVEVLIDELATISPKVSEMTEKRRNFVVDTLTKEGAIEMVGLFGYPIDPRAAQRKERAKWKKEEQEKNSDKNDSSKQNKDQSEQQKSKNKEKGEKQEPNQNETSPSENEPQQKDQSESAKTSPQELSEEEAEQLLGNLSEDLKKISQMQAGKIKPKQPYQSNQW